MKAPGARMAISIGRRPWAERGYPARCHCLKISRMVATTTRARVKPAPIPDCIGREFKALFLPGKSFCSAQDDAIYHNQGNEKPEALVQFGCIGGHDHIVMVTNAAITTI